MNLDQLPRFRLAQLPTPIEELPRLSKALGGPRILIKRDDQTGLALGGNKTRKLEYLIGDALAQGADTVITLGAAQSNHARQTAAACAKAGLACELILNGARPDLANGNLLLNQLFGAREHWIDRSQRAAKLSDLTDQLTAAGRQAYPITVGGSNGIGAIGYVNAMLELKTQLTTPVDCIAFGTSSGGTQAGIVLGAKVAGVTAELLGLSIDKNDPEHFEYEAEVASIANDCAARIGAPHRFKASDIEVTYGYKGEGYGVVGDLEREAIRLMARTEGILLDPVYAGRAFGALVDLIRKGRFKSSDTILFWHTGGSPALFAYARELAA